MSVVKIVQLPPKLVYRKDNTDFIDDSRVGICEIFITYCQCAQFSKPRAYNWTHLNTSHEEVHLGTVSETSTHKVPKFPFYQNVGHLDHVRHLAIFKIITKLCLKVSNYRGFPSFTQYSDRVQYFTKGFYVAYER